MTDTAIVIAIMSALISLAGTVLQVYKWRTGEQPKSKADTADVLTDTSLSLVGELRKERDADRQRYDAELERMKARVDALENENKSLRDMLAELEDLRDWSERLYHQVKALGGVPVKMRDRKAQLPDNNSKG